MSRPRKGETAKLKRLGISKADSYRWQKLARIPEDVFEKLIERKGISQSKLLKLVDAVENGSNSEPLEA